MRRGINIRKKKRYLLNQINQKSLRLFILLIIVLCVCALLYSFFIQNTFIKNQLEKDSVAFSKLNDHIPFRIQKIILFSSATAQTNRVNQTLSLDISQFCDIGIYITNLDEANTSIQSLSIEQISISTPEVGTPCLYPKYIDDLGKCSYQEENKIQDRFSYDIVDSELVDYHHYELASNASTPICLGFYNQNVKQGLILDENEILYNGTLLKKALIPPSNLKCDISFRIHIVTNAQSEYLCNIHIEIPLQDENNSIYDTGYITQEINGSNISNFIRIQ